MTQFVILSWLDNPNGRSDVSLMAYHDPAAAEIAITGCIEMNRNWQFFVINNPEINLDDLARELRADD